MTTVIDHTQRGHSPLGASGAERWMNCPGSVALLKELALPESDDPSYREIGTAMHEAAEHCLKAGIDTWEIVGETFNNVEIDGPLADAIQVYLGVARSDIDASTFHYVEFPVSSPVHPQFYGTADLVAFLVLLGHVPAKNIGELCGDEAELRVRDLKGGEGIVVEPEENPQLKYYAFGVIDGIERQSSVVLHPDLKVRLGIVQPRAYHEEGPVRDWVTTVGAIKEWVHDTLVPAMLATEYDHTLDAGPWCRFCAAKLVCPLLTSLFRAACMANPKEIINYSDESAGRSYQYVKAVEFYLKALKDDIFRRLNTGVRMDGVAKLVDKKANRVYTSGAAAEAKTKFGADAFTKPEIKSPAELEKLSPAAKAWVKEHAYLPKTGLTVALWDDPKPAVRVQTTKEAFGDAIAALTQGEAP